MGQTGVLDWNRMGVLRGAGCFVDEDLENSVVLLFRQRPNAA